MTVAGGQSNAAESSERWRDIGGSDGLEVFAGLNAETHEQDRNALIVVVRRAVAGAVGPRFSSGRAIVQPVGFGKQEEIPAAAGKVIESERAKRRTLRWEAIFQLFRSVNGGNAGL